MMRPCIVKVGDYWVNLAEVLYVEPSENDEADIRVHFRGDAVETGPFDHHHDYIDLPKSDFEAVMEKMGKERRSLWRVQEPDVV